MTSAREEDARVHDGRPELRGIHYVKLPVTDVEVSRDWYCRVLGFEPDIDFVENGELMGVALKHVGGVGLALRREPARAAALAQYDPLALTVPGRTQLDAWLGHLDVLGVAHGPVIQGRVGQVVVINDPDGIEILLYAIDFASKARAC